MAPNYCPRSINAILEASDDDSNSEIITGAKGGGLDSEVRSRRMLHESNMSPALRNVGERRKDKTRKSHRSVASSTADISRHSLKSKTKSGSSRRGVATALRDDHARHRQYHTSSSRDVGPGSSSDEDDCGDKMEYRQTVMAAARGRLTSPSMVSTLTSLTTASNNSGSSSGSNSTITQASISGTSTLKPPESLPESPVSPAVPDPPDVFAYLEQDDSPAEDEDEGEREEKSPGDTEWPLRPSYVPGPVPPNGFAPGTGSMSSSTSSSMHSDDGASERAADNDTDRSTSPERSVGGDDDGTKSQELVPADTEPAAADPAAADLAAADLVAADLVAADLVAADLVAADLVAADPASADPSAAKIAAQMQAAQHRQNLHGAFQPFGGPQAPRGVCRTAPAPRLPHVLPLRGPPPRPVSRPDPMPLSGYEALAARLAVPSKPVEADARPVKPIYRKFARLNHRLLLHLQDELCELEDSLRLLDSADTHSRTVSLPNAPALDSPFPPVQPASRRGNSVTSRELEWHRLDLMAKIAFKVSQYNQVLSSFHGVSRDLEQPDVRDVDAYREFLGREKLIVESETTFLNAPRGDFLVLGKQRQRKRRDSQPSWGGDDQGSVKGVRSVSSLGARGDAASEEAGLRALEPRHSAASRPSSHVPTLAMMVAAAVLVPILTFAVIPGFLGRMTVVLLVAAGMVGVALQGGLVDSSEVLGQQGYLLQCAGIYAAAMVIVSGVVG